jgi:hypothetical protein
MEVKKEFCAFGAITPHRTGKIVNESPTHFDIKPDDSRWEEPWEKQCVLTFATREEAEKEVEYWNKEKDPRG